MTLSDARLRALKPRAKPFKLFDGGGLYVEVAPTGVRTFKAAYRLHGKPTKMTLGSYPSLSLSDARTKLLDVKALLADGLDPQAVRRAQEDAAKLAKDTTFKKLAAELIARKQKAGLAPRSVTNMQRLLDHAIEDFGDRPVAEITAPMILATLRRLESRGRGASAAKVRAFVGAVLRSAQAAGLIASDPTAALRGEIEVPRTVSRPALLDFKSMGALLRAVQSYDGQRTTAIALELAIRLFPRPGEILAAKWAEFDLEAGMWTVPHERMKMRKSHRVPLPPQALALLRELHEWTGRKGLLFPNLRDPKKPMAGSSLNSALRRMDFTKETVTAHGFRSSASTLLNESGLWSVDAIERQLAHAPADEVRAAYMRSQFWQERVAMVAWYSDRLDEAARGGEIVILRRA